MPIAILDNYIDLTVNLFKLLILCSKVMRLLRGIFHLPFAVPSILEPGVNKACYCSQEG